MRLIDADELKKYISKMPLTNASKEMFQNVIKAQPTAIAVKQLSVNKHFKEKNMIRAYDEYGNVVELVEYEKEIRADEREKTIEFVVDKIIFPLLDEYDIKLWEDIDYIELAEKWVEFVNARKGENDDIANDLKNWIAKQMKGRSEVTCIDCVRYGDLHSSCSLARDMKLNEDSPICESFKGKE